MFLFRDVAINYFSEYNDIIMYLWKEDPSCKKSESSFKLLALLELFRSLFSVFFIPGKSIQLNEDGKRQSMLVLPGVLGPRPPSGGCDWVVWAFQRRAQVERGEMEGIVGHRYPIIWLEGVPPALTDGPAWGVWAPLCFTFDDKLFCWRIMVNAIMSNDGEPQNDSQKSSCEVLIEELDSIYRPWLLYIHMVISLNAFAQCRLDKVQGQFVL